MELFFLALLVLIMATALGSGYPVAFALPGAAIITIILAAASGALFAGDMDAYFHTGGLSQWLTAGVTNLRGVYWEVERDTLIAIPLFIFMGIMLQRSKIAEDLLVTMAQLFGPIPGGLGISVVFVGALLAATTGIVGATVVAMGLISLPAMLRNNYSKSLATGTIAASGTLGQIIPPSIVLIILADQLASAADQASTIRKTLYRESTGEISMPSIFGVTSTSAGEMFLGAFVPGMLLVGIYMLYILIIAVLRPGVAPSVKVEGKFDTRFWLDVALTLIPPLALIFLVLGSIIGGIATVNQAGAIGAAGAMIMAGYRLKESGRTTFVPALMAIFALLLAVFALYNYPMNVKSIQSGSDMFGIIIGVIAAALLLISLAWSGWRTYKTDNTLHEVMIETSKTTSLVFIILLGAAMLTAAFRAFGGEELVKDFLNSLPGGFWSKFIIVMMVIFVLGFFLDFIEIAVVVVPIVAPILLADPEANITAVWLGVMIGLNIQTSFLTPPFGFALFYLRGVAPAIVKTLDMYKGVIAFISLQLLALTIVGLYPPLVNYLPNRSSFLSETSPPPRNPRLQYCVEEYTHGKFTNNRAEIDAAMTKAKGLDYSLLPKKLADLATKSFDEATESMVLMAKAKEAEAAVAAGEGAYRPLHRVVRKIQADMRDQDAKIKDWRTAISRARGDENADRRKVLETRIAAAEAVKSKLAEGIPADWKDTQAAFTKLNKAESSARSAFRSAADGSFADIAQVKAVLDSNTVFAELQPELMGIGGQITAAEPAAIEEAVNELSKKFGAIDGADAVSKALTASRRALKSKTPDKEKALAEVDKAIKAYDAQKEWRAKASSALLPGLTEYVTLAQDTFGIRAQEHLTREQGLFMARCMSEHRDVSLSF